MKINLNESVWVHLTSDGESALDNYLADTECQMQNGAVREKFERRTDGAVKFQLWELMRIFGQDMMLGKPNVIKDMDIDYIAPKHWKLSLGK